MNRPINILWLSDIHLKGNDGNDIFVKAVNKLFISLNDLIENWQKDEEQRIDFLFISGDLAFDGTEACYNKLINKLNIIKRHKIPSFIVPGNHDVDHEGFNYLFFREAFKKGADIKQYINKKDLSEKPFIYYSSFYKSFIASTHTGTENNSIMVMDPLKGGYYIDPNRKMIVICINTAWLSFGSSFITWLKDARLDDTMKNNIYEIIRQSDEQGRLVTGVNEFNRWKEFVENVLDDPQYSNFFKITMMHHPVDWLDPEEINFYTADPSGTLKGTLLYQIINNSDLLLTGHSHPAYYNMQNKVCGSTNLVAPMFLPYSDDLADINDSDIGFSVLTIGDCKTWNRQLYYKKSDFKWQKFKPNADQKNPWNGNTSDQNNKICNFFAIDDDNKRLEKIRNYIKKDNDISIDKSLNWVLSGEVNYLITNNNKVVIIIYKKGKKYCFLEELKKIIPNDDSKIYSVIFVKLDLDYKYEENYVSEKYIDTNQKQMDADLEKLKIELFNDLDKNENKLKLFEKMAETQFINKFILSKKLECL